MAQAYTWSVFAIVNDQTLVGKSDLVRLEFNEGDSVCSGFFITPKLIITSAHCLYSWRDGKAAKLTSIITIDEKKLNLEVLELVAHPDYEKGWATHDLAVIRVTRKPEYEGNFVISGEVVPKWGTIYEKLCYEIDSWRD